MKIPNMTKCQKIQTRKLSACNVIRLWKKNIYQTTNINFKASVLGQEHTECGWLKHVCLQSTLSLTRNSRKIRYHKSIQEKSVGKINTISFIYWKIFLTWQFHLRRKRLVESRTNLAEYVGNTIDNVHVAVIISLDHVFNLFICIKTLSHNNSNMWLSSLNYLYIIHWGSFISCSLTINMYS